MLRGEVVTNIFAVGTNAWPIVTTIGPEAGVAALSMGCCNPVFGPSAFWANMKTGIIDSVICALLSSIMYDAILRGIGS